MQTVSSNKCEKTTATANTGQDAECRQKQQKKVRRRKTRDVAQWQRHKFCKKQQYTPASFIMSV